MAPTTKLSEEIGFYFGLAVFVQILILIFLFNLNFTASSTTWATVFSVTFIVLACFILFYFQGVFGYSRYYPLVYVSTLLEFVIWIVILTDSKDFPFEKGGKLLFLGLQFLHVLLTIVFLYKDRKNANLEKFFGKPVSKFKGGISRFVNSFSLYNVTKDCALERCNE
jgi:hypothetical protein